MCLSFCQCETVLQPALVGHCESDLGILFTFVSPVPVLVFVYYFFAFSLRYLLLEAHCATFSTYPATTCVRESGLLICEPFS